MKSKKNTNPHLIGESNGDIQAPHREWALKEEMILNVEQPKTESGQELNVNLQDCVELNVNTGATKIVAKNQKQTLPVVVNIKEIKFDELDIDIESSIDLICVIDISGSMNGSKLEYVKKTMITLLEMIQGKTRLAIILFDDKSEILMNFKIVSPENKPMIAEIIHSIQTRGSTNITAGVHLAQQMLGQRETKNHISAVFLLSDGAHNCGPIGNDVLFGGDVTKTKCEYTLSSFGYGDDHDANLLQGMSEHKGGNYYFVDDISRVEECFLDCLGMVTSVIGQNLNTTFKLIPSEILPELRFSKTFGPYWNNISEIEKTFSITSLYSGMNKNLLCLLEFNPIKPGVVKEETEIKIAMVTLTIETLSENPEKISFKKEVFIKILPEDSTEDTCQDIEVQKQLTRVEGAEVIEIADKLRSEGQYEEAVKMMDNFDKQLDEQSFKEEGMFKEMGEAIKKQREMTKNEKNGIQNNIKSVNFAMQQKNIYAHEASAPMFSKAFQNKRQKKMTSKYS